VAGNLERELMAAEGLPLAWFEVLLALDQSPDGALRLQRLMDTVLMTKSGVSRLVDRMEAAGLGDPLRLSVGPGVAPSPSSPSWAGRSCIGRPPSHFAAIDRHLAPRVLDAEEAAPAAATPSALSANALGQ